MMHGEYTKAVLVYKEGDFCRFHEKSEFHGSIDTSDNGIVITLFRPS